MFCKSCGKEINDGAGFCLGCGAAIEAPPVYQPPPVQGYASPPTPPPEQGYQPAPQQGQGGYTTPPGYGQPPPQQAPPPVQGYQPPPPVQGQQQGYAPPPVQGYAPPPAKKFPKWLLIVIIAVAVVVALAVIGVISEKADKTTDGDSAIETTDETTDEDPADETTEEDSDDDPANENNALERGEYIDFPIMVGEGTDFPLNGMMSIPDGIEGKAPAVVLVQGTGQFNMDEETHAIAPFRDIADYLASYGIAVVRFDKRNYEHWAKMKEVYGGSITLKEDVIEDVILAAELAKADPRIDENRVYIIGHSLGGTIAVRIHAEGGDFAGIISMAGTPRSAFEVGHDQQMAQIELMPEGEEKEAALEQAEYYNVEYWQNRVMSMSDDVAKDKDYGGYSYYYEKDWEGHPVSMYIDDIKVPFLILQGADDFLITAKNDLPAWKDTLAGRDNVTFILYEGLNHFFMTSQGGNINTFEKETEYPGHTDEQVLADIVEWIHSN